MTTQQSAAPRTLLALAAVAVAFAAADTYVVVLSLPDMMTSVDLNVDELQRAAPIISGFLLGYVAMLPLIGRIADLRGRLPVLVAALVLFAFGSLVTAAAYDLPSLVAGRFLQGVGGGGLVPVTLALVADIYPVERRGVPLGVVGAVQELGSVLGPLYGAVVIAFGDWRDIFWINLAVGLVLAAGVAALGGPVAAKSRRRFRVDVIGLGLTSAWIGALLLVMRQPEGLTSSLEWGPYFLPFGDATSIWWSQVGLVTIGVGLLALGWLVVAPSLGRCPFFDVRDWWGTARNADLLGALLLAVALGGVILAFASADPEQAVFSDAGPAYLALSAVASIGFVLWQRRARHPLIPRGSFVARPAWGSLVTSFFIGAALIAALVDVPVFARITVYGDSQVKAALVLVELLVALPVGALIGGYLTRSVSPGVITGAGMLGTATGFFWMAQWGTDALNHPSSSVALVLTGLGFGLALAPVNAALLATTNAEVHGVTSALLVVSRMVGMLVGISALTTIGLTRFYDVANTFPSVREVCAGASRCDAYDDLAQSAALSQTHAIFYGAAVCALIAGALALALFRGARTRGAKPGLLGLGA